MTGLWNILFYISNIFLAISLLTNHQGLAYYCGLGVYILVLFRLMYVQK